MNVIYFAAFCMIFQDIFEAMKDMSQARNRRLLAGLFDSLMYLSLVPTMYVSVTVWSSHDIRREIAALVLITIANFIGQGIGVSLGRDIKYEKNKSS